MRKTVEIGPQTAPPEIAKIATVLVLARRFDDPKLDLSRIRHWLPAMLITLVPFALVAKEPDLGTSLSFPAILVALVFVVTIGAVNVGKVVQRGNPGPNVWPLVGERKALLQMEKGLRQVTLAGG